MQFTYSPDYLGDGIKFLADSSNGSRYPSARKAIAAALAAHGLIKLTFLGACARYSDMQSTGARVTGVDFGFSPNVYGVDRWMYSRRLIARNKLRGDTAGRTVKRIVTVEMLSVTV